MSEKQQEQEQNSSKYNNASFIRSVILIILETYISFIIKHDQMAHRYASQFISKHISIQFNTFLPSDVFFATFTHRGVLFDHFEPQHPKPTITIYASTIDLIRIILMGNEGSLYRIRILGEDDLQEELRMFIRSISVPNAFSNWKHGLSKSPEQQKEELLASKRNVEPLLKRIEEQKMTIAQLNVQVKSHQNDLKALQSKYTLFTRLYLFIIIILCISIIGLVCYNLT